MTSAASSSGRYCGKAPLAAREVPQPHQAGMWGCQASRSGFVPPVEPLAFSSAIGVLLQPLPGADLARFEQLRQHVENPALRDWIERSPRSLEEVLARVAEDAAWEVLDETEPRYVCNCSREKAESVLRMMEPMELKDMLDTDGQADITCHFCAERYDFSGEQLRALLRESTAGRA